MIELEIGEEYFNIDGYKYEVVRKQGNYYFLCFFEGESSKIKCVYNGDIHFDKNWFKTYKESLQRQVNLARSTLETKELFLARQS